MSLVPHLMRPDAPKIKYTQGDIDSCVFSLLASALYYTGHTSLRHVAHILQQKTTKYSGSVEGLFLVKEIVKKHAPWLECKRVKPSFNWMKDINDYMIVVGVIKDSEGSCQHAVTIFRKWIFDSTEEFAFPLCKESLDCCTWQVKDGERHVTSFFVRFIDGWIFYEAETKKKKQLDKCN